MYECYDCGEEFKEIGECPYCGSGNVGKLDVTYDFTDDVYDDDYDYSENDEY